MTEITIETNPKYTVTIGKKLTEQAGNLLKPLTRAQKLMIVSDDTVFSLYGKTLLGSLRAQGYQCFAFILEPGERSKSAASLISLWDALADNGFLRSDAVVSLGGGVVSDLGGLAASTYMRGIRHFIFPTTLLAMADASVGGKNAVDLKAGKNLVGTFYEPAAVFCDTSVLATLSESCRADGMAEIIKCGMIRSEKLLFDICGNISDEEMIKRAVEIKKEFVERDEKDTGERHMLNFGHTLAHAAETLSGGRLTHGKAVSSGMYIMTRAAVKNGICTPATLVMLEKILDKYGLPKAFPFPLRELCAAALNDKKRTADKMTLILPVGIGRAVLTELPADKLYEFLN